MLSNVLLAVVLHAGAVAWLLLLVAADDMDLQVVCMVLHVGAVAWLLLLVAFFYVNWCCEWTWWYFLCELLQGFQMSCPFLPKR